MRRNQPRQISNFAAGAIVLTLVAIGTYLGFAKEIPFRHHYTISGVFTSSNNLRKNSPVRIAGINVGKVVEVKKLGGDTAAAVVKMRIDKRGLPIHKDAKLAIRPRIFLEGNFFVDIQPGSPSAPKIGDGDTIPINQTRTPVQLDQILTTLQAPTRKDLQDLLHSLSVGFSGAGGKGYNQSIPYWVPAYRDSAIVGDATLGEFQHDLSGYIAGAGKTAAALDRDPAQLKSLVTDLDTSFGAFAARDKQLTAAIAELPNTLRAGSPALAALNRDFAPLRSFVKDLRPGVRSSGPTLDAALPFVTQLRGLVRPTELRGLVHDLRPTVPSLTKLNVKTSPLLEQVRSASSCQNEVILPWTKDKIDDQTFPATGPVYVDSVKGLPGIAGESRAGDANGQWFRVLVTGGLYAYPETQGIMLTGNPIMGANPPVMERSPLRPNVPCETQQSPDLRSIASTMPAPRKAVIPASKQGELLKLRDKAVKWMKGTIKTDGLTKKLTVSAKPATEAIVDKLKAIRNRNLLRNDHLAGGEEVITAIRKSLSNFVAVIVLMVIAAGVGGYILSHQRVRFPWEAKTFELKAAFSTAQAVTPGQGQTVRISGVRIGDISKVELKDGRAIVTMQVDPEYKDVVHTDATALLRPKTGLKDMFIELNPGSKSAPLAKKDWTLPVSNTLPDVNPDEIFSSLDSDTRDYLKLLVDGAGTGLHGRGNSLKEVFARFEPTHKDLARVSAKLATRHKDLKHLIRSLNVLNGELANHSSELSQLVDSSAMVFRSFASEEGNISDAVSALPGALHTTTSALTSVHSLANVLGPAVTNLRPAVKALDPSNRAVRPFFKSTAPLLKSQIRPFVTHAQPVIRSLQPASDRLAKATPDLAGSFTVLNHLLNMVGYNQNGKEGPSVKARDEGYLFWIAWLQHDAASLFSSSDANGTFRPVTLAGFCGTIKQVTDTNPALAMVLAPALLDPKICNF